MVQSNVSAEAVLEQEAAAKKLDARHRHWNSFASNSNSESPCIGAHYAPNALSRGSSVDTGLPEDDTKTLRQDALHTRYLLCWAQRVLQTSTKQDFQIAAI